MYFFVYHSGDEVTTFSEFLFLFLFFVFYKKVSRKTFTLFTTASLTEKLFTKSSQIVHQWFTNTSPLINGRASCEACLSVQKQPAIDAWLQQLLTPPPLYQRGTALENVRDLLNFPIASLFTNSLARVHNQKSVRHRRPACVRISSVL